MSNALPIVSIVSVPAAGAVAYCPRDTVGEKARVVPPYPCLRRLHIVRRVSMIRPPARRWVEEHQRHEVPELLPA